MECRLGDVNGATRTTVYGSFQCGRVSGLNLVELIGPVSIGTVGYSTSIYGTLSIPGTMTLNNIQAASSSTAVNIYTNTTAAITIGATTASVNIPSYIQTPKIQSAGTSIDIGDPIAPSYAYDATTGTGVFGTIGYIYSFTSTAAVNVSTVQKNILNLPITDIGVYLINVNLIITNPFPSLTIPRLYSNLGYGATGGTSSGITQYRMVDNLFQTFGTAGDSLTMTYSAVYTVTTVTTPNNFLTVSAIASTNALQIMSASIGSKITATRIA